MIFHYVILNVEKLTISTLYITIVSVTFFYIYLFVCLTLSTILSVYLFMTLTISDNVSVCLSVYLWNCKSCYLTFRPSNHFLICLSVFLSICLSIDAFINMSLWVSYLVLQYTNNQWNWAKLFNCQLYLKFQWNIFVFHHVFCLLKDYKIQ